MITNQCVYLCIFYDAHVDTLVGPFHERLEFLVETWKLQLLNGSRHVTTRKGAPRRVNWVPEQETGIIERGCNNPTILLSTLSPQTSPPCRYWNFPFPPLLSAAQKRGALGRDSAGAWPWRSSSLCLQGYSIVRHLLSSHDNRCRFCRPLGGFKRDFHPKQVPLAQQRKETVVTGFFSSGEGLWSL